jgi:hypothetical protein
LFAGQPNDPALIKLDDMIFADADVMPRNGRKDRRAIEAIEQQIPQGFTHDPVTVEAQLVLQPEVGKGCQEDSEKTKVGEQTMAVRGLTVEGLAEHEFDDCTAISRCSLRANRDLQMWGLPSTIASSAFSFLASKAAARSEGCLSFVSACESQPDSLLRPLTCRKKKTAGRAELARPVALSSLLSSTPPMPSPSACIACSRARAASLTQSSTVPGNGSLALWAAKA